MKQVAIFGAGGFGREAAFALGDGPACYVVHSRPDGAETEIVGGKPVLVKQEFVPVIDTYGFVIAIGNPVDRFRIVNEFEEFAPRWHTIIAATTRIGPRCTIGEGSIICDGNVITCDVTIGSHVHINISCTVGHDAVVGDFVTFSPGVHVSGGVKIGAGVFIGTGAVILPCVNVGAWSRIGAGAVIIEDVPANTTVVGVPGKVVGGRDDGWHLLRL